MSDGVVAASLLRRADDVIAYECFLENAAYELIYWLLGLRWFGTYVR
jgi:hypothetical protein